MFKNFLNKNKGSKGAASLLKTALTQFHVDHGGNLVEYAGYSVPDYYQGGPVSEHLSCRK